jgi:ubiquinone/menaquinone biosynthesis C-methylase UbiE
VLIAGCGTGKQPIVSAIGYRNSDVLAVDLSRASLTFAKRKAQELNVENIRFAQADIMRLDVLDERDDVIECAEVLHHMARARSRIQSAHRVSEAWRLREHWAVQQAHLPARAILPGSCCGKRFRLDP